MELLKSIVEQHAGILRENPEVLLQACRWGYPSIVKYSFIELKQPVNRQGENKSTLLHEAARRGHREIVKILLKRGTPIDIRDRAQETPLQEASRWGKWPVAALLLKRGAR